MSSHRAPKIRSEFLRQRFQRIATDDLIPKMWVDYTGEYLLAEMTKDELLAVNAHMALEIELLQQQAREARDFAEDRRV